jgi:aminoglycoside phosphotransferase
MGTYILRFQLLFGVGLNARLPFTGPLAQRGRLPFGVNLHGHFGACVLVITYNTVLKVKRGLHPSEAAITKFVHDTTGCPTPDIFDVALYGDQVGIIMTRVQGVSLSSLWKDMDPTDKCNIINQLKEIIREFRTHESTFIGRPGRQPGILPMGFSNIAFGPFEREQDFNQFRLSQMLDVKLMARAAALQNSGHKFVLTHGDLSDRNIMVHNGKITGIIDWEYGGFYPEYWEYVAAQLNGGHDDVWRRVLNEVLEDKYSDMVDLERILRN